MKVIFIASALVLGYCAYSIESRSFDEILISDRVPQEKQDEFLTKQKIKSFECRIGNGQRAAEGQFPWHTWLDFFFLEENPTSSKGTLITSTWVVTNANILSFNVTGIHLYFGSVDRNNFPEARYAKSYEVHPSYDMEHWEYNIALVQLNAAVPFKPVNLPARNSISQSYEGVNMLVAGFGGNPFGGTPVPPSQFLMYTIAIGETNYGEYELRARTIGNSYIEYGDVGGALLHNSDTFVGILQMFEAPGNALIFRRVAQHLDWIAYHTGVQIH